jgi:hypothetical protein
LWAIACLAAGYASKPEFARGNGCKLLRDPEVSARIDELRAEFRERCALQLEYIQALLLPIVEANVLDLFEREPQARRGIVKFKDLDRLRRDQGLAIANIKLNEQGAIEDVKFHVKVEAARVLLATLGVKDSEQNQSVFLLNLGDRLRAALAADGEKRGIDPVAMLDAPGNPQAPGMPGPIDGDTHPVDGFPHGASDPDVIEL